MTKESSNARIHEPNCVGPADACHAELVCGENEDWIEAAKAEKIDRAPPRDYAREWAIFRTFACAASLWR